MSSTNNTRAETALAVEAVVRKVSNKLIDGGIRVITIAALYDQVQRAASRMGVFAPSWSSLVETLRGMDGYQVSYPEDYSVTLPPGEDGGRNRPCMLEAVYRVIDGIDAYDEEDTCVPEDAERLIQWAREQLATAAPEREE